MRVWLIQRSEPTPHDDNGGQRLLRTGIVADMLVAAGHEVVWWTSTFDHYNRRQRFPVSTRLPVSESYEIQYLRGRGYKRNISLARFREHIDVSREFARLAPHELRPDIIVASVPTVELAAAATGISTRAGIPIIVDVRDLWPDVFEDVVPRRLRFMVRLLSIPMRKQLHFVCSRATAIVGLTGRFVEWGAHAAKRPVGKRDRVVPLAYISKSLPEESLQRAREKWRNLGVEARKGHLIVAFFGTFGRGFDLDVVMKAAAALQQKNAPIRFVICGSGENSSHLEKQVRTLDNVLLPGWVNAAEIRALLEISDLGLAPYVETKNFVDNITNKPAEYLSGSIPVVSSLGHGQLYNLLNEYKCGISYNNSAEILAEKLDKLEKDPELLQEMKISAGKLYSDLFDGDVVYGQFVEYLEHVVDSFKAS
jgi:glycosyltransferase involved in cell wall biosynthesis